MIFVIHYILYNAGLSAILILLTLFLQTYTAASLSEIGALLMLLPFGSMFVKPLFCALADRQQAHKLYLIGALLIMALGFGSLTIAPFFPDFYLNHGRLNWYFAIVGVIVGFGAFGVAWSLGDALSVNAARIKNIPWGLYRVWATVSWGVFGYLIGFFNETPLLPKYVPAFFVMCGFVVLEAILLAFWPNKHFDMAAPSGGQEPPSHSLKRAKSSPKDPKQADGGHLGGAGSDLEGHALPKHSHPHLNDTLSGSARLNPRLMGAMANMLMEDLGGSIKSSLRLGTGTRGQQKRTALVDILEQHQLKASSTGTGSQVLAQGQATGNSPASGIIGLNQQPQSAQPNAASMQLSGQQLGSGKTGSGSDNTQQSLGRAALRRTHNIFSRMNSLSSASGHAIASQLHTEELFGNNQQRDSSSSELAMGGAQGTGSGSKQVVMTMSSLASNASLSRAAAARAMGFGPSLGGQPGKDSVSFNGSDGNNNNSNNNSLMMMNHAVAGGPDDPTGNDSTQLNNSGSLQLDQTQTSVGESNKSASIEDLQLVLLKLIMKRDENILKYLLMFTLFGILFTIHTSYFFLHVELVCRQRGYDFSSVTGALIAAQSGSEIICFLFIVPYFVPCVGRMGAFVSSALVFAGKYAFYGTYFHDLNPYWAMIPEAFHGLAYGITINLVTELAVDSVNQVDDWIPELIRRRIIEPSMDPNRLKLPLRATMQAVFSGAYDGLGNGLGALIGGLYLDKYPGFISLWVVCTYLSTAVAILYPLLEARKICARAKGTAAT